MAYARIPEEHLQEFLRGCAHGLHMIAGHVDNFLRPAEPGLPEEEGEYEEGEYNIGHRFPPLREDDHQLEDTDEEEDDVDTDDEDDWSDWSEDSGYGSMSEEDEDAEEEEQEHVDEDVEDYSDDDNILRHSPLNQHFPPPEFWQQSLPVCPSFPTYAPLWLFPFGGPQQELPVLQVRQPEDGPSASQRSEESASSTSGLGSSTKRSREESDTLQVSTKRLKWNYEGSSSVLQVRQPEDGPSASQRSEELPPSTSGLGPYIYRSREDTYGESAHSSSGLSPSTYRRREDSSRESAPSTSGLSSSTKRSREGSDTLQVSTKRLKWNCEYSHNESPPSTSGLSSSTYRRREDSSRESAPSTSGLGLSPFRRYWMGPFDYMKGTEDSDSD